MEGIEETSQGETFKDRKTRLVVFGILQILLGGFCAMIVPLMIFSIIMIFISSQEQIEQGQAAGMIYAIVFYALAAAWFITIGIGSIRTRRWARAMVLVSSWPWLVCGVLGFIFVLLTLPAMYDQLAESGRMPREIVVLVKIIVVAFMTFLYIVIPGSLVLAYSGRDVKATCECRDPHIRWTDKCPLPVLVVSLMCLLWAVSLLFMGVYGWVIPFFGMILSGIHGAAVIVIFALLLAWTAWGMYRLDIKAWWSVLLINAAWIVSSMVTFSRISLWEFYERMDLSGQQFEQLEQFTAIGERYIHIPLILWMIVVAAYLLRIRKYFKSNTSHISSQL